MGGGAGSGGSGRGLDGLGGGLGGMSGSGGLSSLGGMGRLASLGGSGGEDSDDGAGSGGKGGGGFASMLRGAGGGQDSSSTTSTSTSTDSQDKSPAAEATQTSPRAEPTPAGCKAYRMVGARGTTEGPSGSIAYSALERKILAAVSGGAIEEIQYSTSADYGVTVTQGANTGLKMIRQELAKCPKTVYVLFGYSKGAMVITQMLSKKQIPSANLAAVILFGNPYFKAGAPQNKCTAKTGAGVAAWLSPKLPEDIIDRVYDCCSTGDTICQTAGTIIAHLNYGTQFADGAMKFVVTKLQEKLGTK